MSKDMLEQLWYRKRGNKRWMRAQEPAQPRGFYTEREPGFPKSRCEGMRERFPKMEYRVTLV